MDGSLDLYVVGGATSAILRSKGSIQAGYGLLQTEATYQVVPILEALDIEDFLKAVFLLCL